MASSSSLVVTEEGQLDGMESVCADTDVIYNCSFVLSKLEEKVYTDGQRELCVGLQMWALSDETEVIERADLNKVQFHIWFESNIYT